MENKEEFLNILEKELIYPVYQPIVCLKTGTISAYEALSRIEMPITHSDWTISELFLQAKELQKLTELEALCRKKIFENMNKKPQNTKIFLNISAPIMENVDIIAEFSKYNLNPNEFILEVSEQTPITNPQLFQDITQKYRQANFKIAIDDFGTGFANLDRICHIPADYIKLDISLIKNIERHTVKQAIVESIVHFCRKMNVDLVAEGIETKDELAKLIELGVDYGQGFLLNKAYPEFSTIKNELTMFIYDENKKKQQQTCLGLIHELIEQQPTLLENECAETVYRLFREDPEIQERCVVNERREVVGVITRRKLVESFSGQYGYTLHAKKTITEIMSRNVLNVPMKTSIESVAADAMARSSEQKYEAVVVTDNNCYIGIVTIQKLLISTLEWQVQQAVEVNPLTKMPGNQEIQKHIWKKLNQNQHFSVLYFDLDHFKTYNDSYGFQYGDQMIQALATSILKGKQQGWFAGHVGGDDFIVIMPPNELQSFCKRVFHYFDTYTQRLYHPTDYERGYIIGEDRTGKEHASPLVSISVGTITNNQTSFLTAEGISVQLSHAKKRSKQIEGHSIFSL